jgi:AmmeMemoRadiSam system protein B
MTGAKIRKAELAGAWYPATAQAAVEAIKSWRPYIELSSGQGRAICAIIPHAGWYFSSRLAARTILRGLPKLRTSRPRASRGFWRPSTF